MDKRMLSIIQDYFTTQPVVKAWIFGSFARGEANDQSDIDILVTLDKNAHMWLMGFAAMSVDLEGMLNRTVDIVVDDCVKSFARESVDADKMLIYERAS
ncbi:MAG: nucleotidyltransferase domain-containing protein [Bacteroidales bacterium]|nr:nucleotidyltransferase domain-containing protein [Bacteroidales bacterium]